MLLDARERTLALYAHLDLSRVAFPCIPIVNPALWELAHIAWFQEYWCLRRTQKGELRPSLLEGADALFDSGAVAHDDRWHLAYPSEPTLRRYMADTLDATLEALARRPDDERYFFRLALLHEDMHGEALLMTLQTLALPMPSVGATSAPANAESMRRDIAFAGGEFFQGTAPHGAQFVFDNEKWAHRVRVAPFAMASLPVSQGEFRAFVEDGGYAREPLWTAEGATWRASNARTAPLHWKREDGAWQVRRFDRWVALDPAAPMVHVTLHEARAYCRWARRRLPTETEWEFAARNGGADDRYPWGDVSPAGCGALDLRHDAPSFSATEPAPSRSGLRLMMGGVWEWTDSAFVPYPGFAADPYRDYSQPWFHTHQVLRGGSFATRGRLVHNRFRNFYLPARDDVFAGLRTCASEPGRGVS